MGAAAEEAVEAGTSAQPEAEDDEPMLWAVAETVAPTWWTNCRHGATRRIRDNLARMRRIAKDPNTPEERRAQVQRALRDVEYLEDAWDVRLCEWVYER